MPYIPPARVALSPPNIQTGDIDISGTAYAGGIDSATAATLSVGATNLTRLDLWGGAQEGIRIFQKFAAAGATPEPMLWIRPVAHPALANAEYVQARFDGGTLTFQGGATVSKIRTFNINAPTFLASSALTFTNASTLTIVGPPVASTNVTITNPWALRVESGNCDFGGNVVASQLRSGTLDTNVVAALNIGTTNASSTTIGKAGTTTTFNSAINATSIDTGTVTALAIGGTNSNAVNIGRGGSTTTVSGTLSAATLKSPSIDTATAVAMNIGTTTASSVTVGNASTTTTVNGTLSAATIATTSVDTATAAALNIGVSNQNSLTISRSGITTLLRGAIGYSLQQPTFSATMSINPALGSIIVITPTANFGAWTMSNVIGGQVVVLIIVQDATGGRTIGTPPSNIVWLPTTYLGSTHAAPTLTTTAGKRDAFWLQYDQLATKYVEFARNMNY